MLRRLVDASLDLTGHAVDAHGNHEELPRTLHDGGPAQDDVAGVLGDQYRFSRQ